MRSVSTAQNLYKSTTITTFFFDSFIIFIFIIDMPTINKRHLGELIRFVFQREPSTCATRNKEKKKNGNAVTTAKKKKRSRGRRRRKII